MLFLLIFYFFSKFNGCSPWRAGSTTECGAASGEHGSRCEVHAYWWVHKHFIVLIKLINSHIFRRRTDLAGWVALHKMINLQIPTFSALKLYKADIRLSHYTRERLTCCQKLRLRCCAACCPLPDDDAKLHLQQKGPGLKGKKKTNKPGKKWCRCLMNDTYEMMWMFDDINDIIISMYVHIFITYFFLVI